MCEMEHAKAHHFPSPSSNYLVHLDPVVFSYLTKLQHLDLSHNFLMSLPQPFFQVTKVTDLLIFIAFAFQAITTSPSLQLVYLQVNDIQLTILVFTLCTMYTVHPLALAWLSVFKYYKNLILSFLWLIF